MRGFTLLELIIVLIISMLLITIGIPGFKTLIDDNRLTSVAAKIQNKLFFARGQSVALISYITACPLESNTCTNNWINGIDIFIDANRNKVYDSGEVLLQSADKFNQNDKLVFSSTGVTFAPDGHITGSSGTFRYCTGDEKVGVHLALTGRAKIIDGAAFTDCN